MLSYDQIQEIVCKEVDAAAEYSTKRLPRRQEAWDRYYGRPLGNEVDGRSKFITRDTMETIEWMMPFFIRTFSSGDPKLKLKIKGQPAWVGEALMEKIGQDMSDVSPSLFLLEYQWFKDALVSDTAFVKPQWLLDIEKVDIKPTGLSRENVQRLFDDPEVKVKDVEQVNDVFGPPTFNVSATVDKVLEDTIVADNVPYWEFMTSPDAKDVNDEHPKGQNTVVTLDYLKRISRSRSKKKEPFFRGLQDIEDSLDPQAPPVGYPQTESMGESHTGYDGEPADNKKYHARNIKTLELVEWCTRIDVNEDGFLEDIVCWLVSGEKIHDRKLIRWEPNREGFIPFCSLKPIIDCYKLYGISWADLIIEIQNLHTVLIRRILDNFDFQNIGRWIVDPEANVDMKSLLEHAPGSAIIGKLDGIKEVTPKGYMSGPLQILEYVKSLKESRTGVSDASQGVPDPLNQTRGGIELVYSNAMQRLELIARIFAETGLSDLYKKFAMLYQRYMRKPFMTEKFGDQRQVTPDMIKGKVIVTVNMGVAANLGAQEAAKVSQVIGFLKMMEEGFPGLLSPEKIHNISRKYITSMGFRDVDDFMNDMKTYVGEYQKRMQAQKEQHEKMIALQTQMDTMDRQLKGMDIQTRAQTEDKKIMAEDVQSKRKTATDTERIEAQREKVDTDAAAKLAIAKIAAGTSSRKTSVDREKVFMDAMTNKVKLLLEGQKIKAMEKSKNRLKNG